MRNILVITLAAFLLLAPACANKAQQGAGVGALSGALIGSLLSGDKLIGAGIGAGIGLALGYIIGNEWDKSDQRKLNNTLETSPSGTTTTWRNPDNNTLYQATPQAAYEQDDRIYRDVTIQATNENGEQETVQATAYRQSDGTWRLVQ